MPRIILLTFFLFVFFHAAFAQNLFTLEQALAEGIQGNYDLVIANNNGQISAQNVTYGNAGFLPRISTNIAQATSVNNTNLKFFNGVDRNAKNAETKTLVASVGMNWTVFDGLNMFVVYQRLKTLNEIERLNMKEVLEQTVLNVESTYYNVILQKKLLKAIEQNILLYEKIVDLVQTRLSIGAASKYELMQAQVELNNYRSNSISQKVALENAKVELNTLLTRDVEQTFEVEDTIRIGKRIMKEEVALTNNNTLLISERNRAVSQLLLQSSKAQYYPIVGINTSYNYLKSQSELGNLLFNQTNGWSYGFTASWNLFNGFNQRRVVQANKINNTNAEIGYKKARVETESALSKSYKDYNANLEILELEKDNIRIARLVAELAIERYRLGMISAFEMQDAQRNLLTAENRFETAKYKAKISELQLLKIDGRIVTARR
ncbi:MAG TPA: TolC family protein [Cytophagaceae bacterium]|jgi:outer membrane protein TolC